MTVTDMDGVLVASVIGEDCSGIWKAVEGRAKAGRLRLVLDLAQVPFLNSVNIAAIISLRSRLQAGGGRLALANLQEPIRAVFRVLKLERLFALDHDLPRALAAAREA